MQAEDGNTEDSEPALARKREFMARLAKFRNRLPVDFKFDREEMNARDLIAAEESASFLKKRSKKLSVLRAVASARQGPQ
jgi:hypothetical protein